VPVLFFIVPAWFFIVIADLASPLGERFVPLSAGFLRGRDRRDHC
jgi:hypothetical protein